MTNLMVGSTKWAKATVKELYTDVVREEFVGLDGWYYSICRDLMHMVDQEVLFVHGLERALAARGEEYRQLAITCLQGEGDVIKGAREAQAYLELCRYHIEHGDEMHQLRMAMEQGEVGVLRTQICFASDLKLTVLVRLVEGESVYELHLGRDVMERLVVEMFAVVVEGLIE